jgi:hypothetical protein
MLADESSGIQKRSLGEIGQTVTRKCPLPHRFRDEENLAHRIREGAAMTGPEFMRHERQAVRGSRSQWTWVVILFTFLIIAVVLLVVAVRSVLPIFESYFDLDGQQQPPARTGNR